jgi:hypothetical protein
MRRKKGPVRAPVVRAAKAPAPAPARKKKKRRRIGDPPSDLDVPAPGAALMTREQAEAEARQAVSELGIETSQEAARHIAEDAVIVLRRELAYRAELSQRMPGLVTMFEINQLLGIVGELAELTRDPNAGEQQADYSRLTPAERTQLAALLLKVEYA